MNQLVNALRSLRVPSLSHARVLPRLRRGSVGPIGFELSHEKLHMLQMAFDGGRPRIRAAISVPYPTSRDELFGSPAKLRLLFKTALAAKPFKGNRVITCMPAEDVKLSLTNYQLKDGDDPAQVIVNHALELIDGAVDDWILDYLPVHSRGEGTREHAALIALARREKVLAFLHMLNGAGIEVDALEIGPVAIQRLVTRVCADSALNNVLTINFGRERTFLTVFCGSHLELDREVHFGESELVEKLAAGLEMSEQAAQALLYRHGVASGQPDALQRSNFLDNQEICDTLREIVKPRFLDLADEVQKVVIYTASQMRGASVDHVYLLGSIARWPGADSLLSGLLSLPVTVLNPLDVFPADASTAASADLGPIAGIAVATGCALRSRTQHV